VAQVISVKENLRSQYFWP